MGPHPVIASTNEDIRVVLGCTHQCSCQCRQEIMMVQGTRIRPISRFPAIMQSDPEMKAESLHQTQTKHTIIFWIAKGVKPNSNSVANAEPGRVPRGSCQQGGPGRVPAQPFIHT
jgi:hypothetical protein